MAGDPTKSDINAIFKRLRSAPANKQCFDCGAMNPTWASVTYGVFLCIDCSAVHRSLGVHLTFIRSTNLDTNWTWLQLRAMQVGGNGAATNFFTQHGCTSNDAQQKYNSRAAKMYREKLHAAASKAMKTHGTKVIIDSHHAEPTSPAANEKEVDFFKEHEDSANNVTNSLSEPIPMTNGTSLSKPAVPEDPGHGPSVDAALSTSPTQALAQAEPRKATIGARKPAGPKKGGLGARKGLGAQKVKANFSEIESAAALRDKEREDMAANLAAQETLTKEEEEKQMASMRLAYKDMSIERKKQEDKLKASDPKKAAQMDRLGMGFGGSRGVSHSVMSDMKTIDQENPNLNNERSADRFNSRRLDDFDDFEFVNSFSGPPKYDSPFSMKKDDLYSSAWGNSSKSNKNSSWDSADRFDSKSSTVEDIPKMAEDSDKGRSRKNYEVSDSTDAQKKFGNAKAISSDQFFGSKDPDFEMKQNLSRYEGSSSISSADLFGTGQSSRNQDYGGAGPDLSEIKEGVKQGVTKVAGKLSSLANGVINSIQDHYG